MASLKQLKGVAYDIAHHAQSGLSWIHPHIGEACQEAGVNEATIKLLLNNSYPANLPLKEPLKLAIGGVKDKYESIMAKIGMPLSAVTSLDIIVIFHENRTDNYTCSVKSIMKTESGKVYEQVVC